MSLAFAAAAGIAGFVLWQAVDDNGLQTVAARVAGLSAPLSAVRLGLIGVLAVAWPWLFRSRRPWLDLRWRVVGWLFVVECLVGQNLFGRFAAAIAGGEP